MEYYVFKKYWNRHIILGPYTKPMAFEMAKQESEYPVGGPVEFIDLAANLGRRRIVKRSGGKVLVEKWKKDKWVEVE